MQPVACPHCGVILEPSLSKKVKPPRIEIDDAFRGTMKKRFREILSDIDERIDEALAHDAAKKYADMPKYIRGWLRRSAEDQRIPSPNKPKTKPSVGKRTADRQQDIEDLQRMKREAEKK